MVSSYYIWAIFYIIGTLYLHNYGIKNDWQKLRINRGLDKNELGNPPSFSDSDVFNARCYKKLCISLFMLSLTISLIVIGGFYLSTPIKEFENLGSYITTSFSLLFLYSLIAGAPLEKEEEQKSYEKIVQVITFIKKSRIENVVNHEINYINKTISSKIRSWYENDSESSKLGALVIRMNSQFFREMLPEDTQSGVRELMQETSLKILTLYSENDMTLLDEILKLFNKGLAKEGAQIVEIAEFINNHETVSKSITKKQINKHISNNLNKDKVKVKSKNVNDVIGLIDTLFIDDDEWADFDDMFNLEI